MLIFEHFIYKLFSSQISLFCAIENVPLLDRIRQIDVEIDGNVIGLRLVDHSSGSTCI